MSDWTHREARLVAAIKNLIEAGDDIRCYPSGAVGFDDWYEATAAAQELLGEYLLLERDQWGRWMDADAMRSLMADEP